LYVRSVFKNLCGSKFEFKLKGRLIFKNGNYAGKKLMKVNINVYVNIYLTVADPEISKRGRGRSRKGGGAPPEIAKKNHIF
jgi:hypothetical protein